MSAPKFKFEIGKTYLTQEGAEVTVLARTTTVGYECLDCSDGFCRYDRSTHNGDAGRVTGTKFDYSDPRNFKRDDLDQKQIKFWKDHYVQAK